MTKTSRRPVLLLATRYSLMIGALIGILVAEQGCMDTSVWVDFFNQHPSPQAGVLTQLINGEVELVTCGVVIAEFFHGIRRSDSLVELESHFRDMDSLSPRDPDSYFAAAALYRELRTRGGQSQKAESAKLSVDWL